jgi:hypothetical protein
MSNENEIKQEATMPLTVAQMIEILVRAELRRLSQKESADCRAAGAHVDSRAGGPPVDSRTFGNPPDCRTGGKT